MTPTGRMFVELVDEYRARTGERAVPTEVLNDLWSSAARAMGNVDLVFAKKATGTYVPRSERRY